MASEARKNATHKNDEERRKELADFLRTRRARVKPPVDRGFPFSRRRTPGLRREEVAEMAGVSASWYTWLEQARDVRPSVELLMRISKVLRLNPFETNHLFDLAGRTPPEALESRHEAIPTALEDLVLNVLQVPAFVMGERFDFLLWNPHFTAHVYDLSRISEEKRTWLDMVFIQDPIRRTRPEWPEDARRAVAEFRWSVGKQIGSPWVRELVSRLCKESPEFAQIWRLHDVQERKKSRILELQNEKLGRRSFLRSIYLPIEAENLRLVILSPASPGKKRQADRKGKSSL